MWETLATGRNDRITGLKPPQPDAGPAHLPQWRRRRRLPGNVTPPEAEELMTSSPQLGSDAVHSETLAKSRRRE